MVRDLPVSDDACSDEKLFCTSSLISVFLLFVYIVAVDPDLPILAQQEYGHARMHREAAAAIHNVDPGIRFTPIIWILDAFLLRFGNSIGMAMT